MYFAICYVMGINSFIHSFITLSPHIHKTPRCVSSCSPLCSMITRCHHTYIHKTPRCVSSCSPLYSMITLSPHIHPQNSKMCIFMFSSMLHDNVVTTHPQNSVSSCSQLCPMLTFVKSRCDF